MMRMSHTTDGLYTYQKLQDLLKQGLSAGIDPTGSKKVILF